MPTANILLIDDNKLNARMIDLILKNDNFSVMSTTSGQEGLELAASKKPDLILLDIMMPVMDGFEVCRRLKASEETRDIPVIFLTSKSDSDGIVKGFELGAADYVTRPFNRTELLARLRTHLALKESRTKVVDLERKNSILAMGATTNHEINQPLTVLTGNLFLLEQSLKTIELSPEQYENIRKMDAAIMKIKELLAKYQDPGTTRFKTYSGSSKLVVFED